MSQVEDRVRERREMLRKEREARRGIGYKGGAVDQALFDEAVRALYELCESDGIGYYGRPASTYLGLLQEKLGIDEERAEDMLVQMENANLITAPLTGGMIKVFDPEWKAADLADQASWERSDANSRFRRRMLAAILLIALMIVLVWHKMN